MFGTTPREIADIAKTQYPDASIRTGVSGRPLMTMPPGATRIQMEPVQGWGDGPEVTFKQVPIGGQEFQLDAPGVTLRDVANGGTQTAAKLAGVYFGAGAPAGIAKILGPAAAEAVGAAKGVGLYFGADKLLDRNTWAHLFGSKQPNS